MNRFLRFFLVAVIVSLWQLPNQVKAQCAAGSNLTTFYAQNNGQDGIMFDITASAASSVTIRCFDSNFDAGTFDVEIYYKAGTHVGFEGNAAAWTLAGTATVTSAGSNLATYIPINVGVTIPCSQSYAFYITTTTAGGGMDYTNGTAVGNVLANDANISILEGTGKDYPYAADFTPRQFNGTVYYDVLGSCATGCTNTVTAFPYTENFETGLGLWTQNTTDNFDWTRDSGGTPSTNTGPTTGNGGSTWYMYMESSSPNYPTMTAILDGPCLDLSTCAVSDFSFAYHMYGASTGSLFFEVEAVPGSGIWTTLWTLSGDQGNAWNTATVSLAAYIGTTISTRFRGVTATSFTSDIAIDDISVTCAAAPACTNTVSSYPYSETFETGTGLWTQNTTDNFDWTRDSGGTPSASTGPTTGNGASTWYMYIESSSPNYPTMTAILDGPCFDLSSCAASDFSFAYHMYGATTGSLFFEVEATPGSGIWTTLWTLSGDQGNAWNTATVSLAAYVGSTISTRFRAVTASSFTSDIAIDDVSVTCTTGGCAPAGLTTFYANNNGQDGIMFDVVATNALTVTCFDSNWDPGTYDGEIYYKAGTHVGFETNAAAWTLAGTCTGATSNGNDVASPIPITIAVAIPAGQRYAFYITNTGGTHANKNYTNGTAVGTLLASDANLSIYEGTGKAYPFGTNYVTREFNGTIYYTTTPLPVELVNFEVECGEASNTIAWQTESEINNNYFEVQASTDGVNFVPMTEVPGQGSSEMIVDYSVTLDKVATTTYYRLKQVDFNGDYEYSNVVVADCERTLTEIALYPNPTSSLLNVDLTTIEREVLVVVTDIVGNIVYSKQHQLNEGLNQFQIDLSGLSSGVYMMNVQGNSGEPLVRRFNKN